MEHISTHYKNFQIRKREENSAGNLKIRLDKFKKFNESLTYFQILEHFSFGENEIILQFKRLKADGSVHLIPKWLGTKAQAAKWRLKVRIFNPQKKLEFLTIAKLEPFVTHSIPSLTISGEQIEILLGKSLKYRKVLLLNIVSIW